MKYAVGQDKILIQIEGWRPRPIFLKDRAWACSGHSSGKAGAVTRTDDVKEGKTYLQEKKYSLSLLFTGVKTEAQSGSVKYPR